MPVRSLARRDPFLQDVWDFRRNFDDLFANLFQPIYGEGSRMSTRVPAVETYIDQNTYHVRMALPGIRPEAVNLQVHQNLLTISGERKQEQKVSDERYLQREFTYGQFERTVPLPEGVQSEKVEAHYRDGVLDVTVPVSEKALPRRIEIKSEGKTAKPLAA